MSLLTSLLAPGNGTSVLLDEQVLTASSDVNFIDIPQDYSDLFISAVVRSAQVVSVDATLVRINGDTGNNYAYNRITGDGATVAAFEQTSASYASVGDVYASTAGAGVYSALSIHFPGYSSTTFQKMFQSQASRITDGFGIWTSIWRSTAAITSLRLYPLGAPSQFVAGSEIRLYGIR